jgi:cell division septation protein DedD
MTSSAHDETFRELQLSGKQLVFLFMAVTVVSVVIFLCGVLVGRGVRNERGGAGTTEATVAPSITEPPLSAAGSPTPNTANSLVTAGEKLTYAERLSSTEPTAEKLSPATPPPPPVAETVAPPSTPAPTAKTTAASSSGRNAAPAATAKDKDSKPTAAAPAATFNEPPGNGFAIQIAALRERSEADAIVSRLVSKGESAYVVAPAKGAPNVFRVRVGKFKERRDADATATRLQKEEQFKPWVVR